MSWFSSFLHPERGYQDALKVLQNYYNEGKGYQQPYQQNGVNQGRVQTSLIDELTNPAALRDKWEKGYKESEAAKNMENMATQHGVNAASSMGLLGSNTALNAIQSGTSQIAAQDKENYLNDLMEKYKTGAGLSQNMYNTGAQTAGQMGQNANNVGQNAAGLTYGATNAGGDAFGRIAGMGVKGLIDYLTGGFGKGGFGRGAWSTGGA
jgi:hypothetical protein